jgi:small subunit ribosomal protein S2
MASPVPMKTLLEAGVHFGHQTRRWDPRMRPFIFTERNGIHIIDLQQTVKRLEDAINWVRDLSARNGVILFVGTKKQAQETIEEEALRCGMPFVNQRWMGGMLTNFQTILGRIRRMEELEQRKERGEFDRLAKKEAAKLDDELQRLHRLLGGLSHRYRLPDAVFIVDPHREQNAVHEARRSEITVVSMVDTNCNPDEIDYPVPANDDAIRAIRLITGKIADAVLEGQQRREAMAAGRDEDGEDGDEIPFDPTAAADVEELFLAQDAATPPAASAVTFSVAPASEQSIEGEVVVGSVEEVTALEIPDAAARAEEVVPEASEADVAETVDDAWEDLAPPPVPERAPRAAARTPRGERAKKDGDDAE